MQDKDESVKKWTPSTETMFVCFDALHPSQRMSSHVGMLCCLLG